MRENDNYFEITNKHQFNIEYSYIGNMGSAQNIELIIKSFLKARIKIQN